MKVQCLKDESHTRNRPQEFVCSFRSRRKYRLSNNWSRVTWSKVERRAESSRQKEIVKFNYFHFVRKRFFYFCHVDDIEERRADSSD